MHLCDSKIKIATEFSSGDRVTLVCEPSGLVKVYKNTELLGSVFCKDYVNSLAGQNIEFSESAENIKVLSRAVRYNETGEM